MDKDWTSFIGFFIPLERPQYYICPDCWCGSPMSDQNQTFCFILPESANVSSKVSFVFIDNYNNFLFLTKETCFLTDGVTLSFFASQGHHWLTSSKEFDVSGLLKIIIVTLGEVYIKNGTVTWLFLGQGPEVFSDFHQEEMVNSEATVRLRVSLQRA